MKKKLFSPLILPVIISALAVSACFYDKFAPPAGETIAPPSKRNESVPAATEDVRAEEVDSLTIETSYKNFFPENEKCRQGYNEYFRDAVGYSNPNSPCSVKLTFERGGVAEKTIEVRRYDSAAKQLRVIEKNVWRAKISGEEFRELAGAIVGSAAFKNWDDRVMINVSNCKITVEHRRGTKSPMSNVGESATAFLPLVNEFKDRDAKTRWEKAE